MSLEPKDNSFENASTNDVKQTVLQAISTRQISEEVVARSLAASQQIVMRIAAACSSEKLETIIRKTRQSISDLEIKKTDQGQMVKEFNVQGASGGLAPIFALSSALTAFGITAFNGQLNLLSQESCGNVPVVGALFRQVNNELIESELGIFITPHIYTDGELSEYEKNLMKKGEENGDLYKAGDLLRLQSKDKENH